MGTFEKIFRHGPLAACQDFFKLRRETGDRFKKEWTNQSKFSKSFYEELQVSSNFLKKKKAMLRKCHNW